MNHLVLRDDQIAATQDRIVRAVSALVAEEHPARISVPAVARRAGVSVATVYRYFPNKTELLDAAALIGNEKTRAWLDDRAVATFDELDELVHRSWHELASEPENLALARNQKDSHSGRELRKRRRAEKRRSMVQSLPALGLDPDGPHARRLLELIELLSSSTSFLELHDHQDLSVDEAADHVSWALRTLVLATIEQQGTADGPATTRAAHEPTPT